MASFLDVCRFNSTAGGTTDWTYSSAVIGYQSPAAAGVINGAVYRYRAESSDLSQWEIGYGAYNTGTGVLARTTVLFNSSGTTSKINFSVAPQVAIVFLAEDFKATGDIPGTATNDNPSAGSIGEFVTAGIAIGSEITLSTGVQTNVVSISLTAGDWDVWGTAAFDTGGSTVVAATIGSVSTTSATLAAPSSGAYFNVAGNVSNTIASTGTTRLSLSATTTVYLVAYSTFTVSTQKVYGGIFARRRR